MTDHLITHPTNAIISIDKTQRGTKSSVTIIGLSRLEFDALPGRVFTLALPNQAQRWQKQINSRLFVTTDEAPTNQPYNHVGSHNK